MINVAIVDDHPIARRGLETILAPYERIGVCVSAGSPAELDAAILQCPKVDVVVTDLYLRGDQPALSDVTRLSERWPVLIMSVSARAADVLAAIRAGARGYITKQASEDSFAAAVESVATGGFYLSSALAHILEAGPQPPGPALSPREEETLSYIARGFTHGQTASRMGISETTVNTYIERIRRKLRLGNKAELTRAAITLEQQHPHTPADHTGE